MLQIDVEVAMALQRLVATACGGGGGAAGGSRAEEEGLGGEKVKRGWIG
jgi:hypothetical protein